MLFIIASETIRLAQFESVQMFLKHGTTSCSLIYYRENTRIMYHTESTEAGIKLQKLIGGISVHFLFSSGHKIFQENTFVAFFPVVENDIFCNLCFSGKQQKLNWNNSEQLFLRKLHLSVDCKT